MKFMRRLATLAILINSPFYFSSASLAEPLPIVLEQVVINVLERHPQLQINDYEARAAAERIKRSRQGTPFELKLDLGNLVGTGRYAGIDGLESSLSIAKILELGNKADSRGELAKQQSQLLKNDQDSKRLDLLAQATEQFIHVVIDQHRLQIAQRQRDLLQQTLDVVEKRIAAGKSHIGERRRINIEIGRANIEQEHAEHELAVSRLKLAASWGDSEVNFSVAEADLFRLPAIQSFEHLKRLLENNPDLIRYATEKRLVAAQLHLAESSGKPDIEISGGIRYLNNSNDAALLFSATMPLGVGTRAQPRINETRLLREREPLRRQHKALSLYITLFEIYQELLHAKTAFDMLDDLIVPESELAERDYRKGYRSGRFSLLELNEAQQTLLDNQLEKIMVAAKYHRLLIEIERLTGAAMYSGDSQ